MAKRIIDYDIFAKNMKRLCKERKMTQQDITKKCGFSSSVISTYITGKYSPSLRRLQDMAYALDVDAREFLQPDGEDLNNYNVVKLYNGLSPSMQVAIVEIMKATQEGKSK